MRFSTTFPVSAAPAEVHAHLMDPRNYVGLAPLVVAVRDIREVGDDIEYVAVERFRLGPFRRDNPIRVRMTGSGSDRVTSRVVSPGGVRLDAVVSLAPAPGGTEVTEDVEVRAPWILRRFVLAKALQAAAGRATELARRFAGSDRS
jgi:carbon monoxide dehydrogenase subunit G